MVFESHASGLITDFLKIQIPYKERIAHENLEFKGHSFGNEKFEIRNGFKPLEVILNESKEMVQVRGSIPFFWQGHNFSFCNQRMIESIELLSETLCIDLMEAEVKEFEAGIVIPVNLPPDYILRNHLKMPGFSEFSDTKKNGMMRGKVYSSILNEVKFYDVVERFKQLKLSKSFIQSIEGFDPNFNYLRLENRIKKPDRYLQVRNLTLKKYSSDKVQNRLKLDLMETYQKIERAEKFRLPESVKNPDLPEILLLLSANKFPNLLKEYKGLVDSMKATGQLEKEAAKYRVKRFRTLSKTLQIIKDERINLMQNIKDALEK